MKCYRLRCVQRLIFSILQPRPKCLAFRVACIERVSGLKAELYVPFLRSEALMTYLLSSLGLQGARNRSDGAGISHKPCTLNPKLKPHLIVQRLGGLGNGYKMIWGLPIIRGTFWGVPIIRTIVY